MRLSLAITASICAAALAGCGSAAKSTSTTTPGAHTSSAPAQTSGSPAVKATVAECKHIIQSQSKLPASAKRKLEGACSQAAKGNSQAVKSVAREVCEEVIGKSGVPSGVAKEEALRACRK